MRVGRLYGFVAIAAALLAVPSAEAVTFRFADPGATSPNGTPDACFNGDDVCGPTLSWTDPVSGLTVTASPLGSATAIIQDLHPNHGGLGAVFDDGDGTYSDPAGDEVNSGQGIRLSFSGPGGTPILVLLKQVRFRDEDHDTDFDDDATFRFRAGADPFETRDLKGTVNFGGLLGTSFDFKYGGSDPEDFYISRMRVDLAEEPIPEPGTLLLLGTGLAGLAARARSRRPRG